MKKIIEAAEIKQSDVIIAIDISGGKINYDNLKAMLDTFKIMVENYNYIGHVLLFDNEIRMKFDIDSEEMHDLTSVNLNGEDNSDYNLIFEYAKNKVDNFGWDIFQIYCLTDGYGIFPEDTEFNTIWITGKSHGEFPFGDITIID